MHLQTPLRASPATPWSPETVTLCIAMTSMRRSDFSEPHGAFGLKIITDDKPGYHVLAVEIKSDICHWEDPQSYDIDRQILWLTGGWGVSGPHWSFCAAGLAHDCASPGLHHHMASYCSPDPLSDGMAGMEVTRDTGISLQ